MFSGGGAVAQLGFASNSFGTVLATLPLFGAAGFVAVLSEPLSHRLLSFVILGIIPAIAVRASGWVLFWALRSASCSCHVTNLRLPGCNHGAHTRNRRRSLEEGKPGVGCSGRRRGEQLTEKGPAEMRARYYHWPSETDAAQVRKAPLCATSRSRSGKTAAYARSRLSAYRWHQPSSDSVKVPQSRGRRARPAAAPRRAASVCLLRSTTTTTKTASVETNRAVYSGRPFRDGSAA